MSADQDALDQRFFVRAGEHSTQARRVHNGILLERYHPPSTNGTQSWKAQRPGPNDPPLLTATVATLEEAEKVLHSWSGVLYLDPNRPL